MKTQAMYRCETHGLLPRAQTRLGMTEPVGGRLECGLCDYQPGATHTFVEEIEVVPLTEVREALRCKEFLDPLLGGEWGHEDLEALDEALDAVLPSTDSEVQG